MTGRRPPFESTDKPPYATFATEIVEKPDGRQVTYYTWPDEEADPPDPTDDAAPAPRPDHV